MATKEQLELSGLIKSVHQRLRESAKQSDPEEVWKEHVRDQNLLKNYAEAMHKLATCYWDRTMEVSCKRSNSRIEWVVASCRSYFHGVTPLLYLFRDKDDKVLQAIDANYQYEHQPYPIDRIKLLDVGSCYNPFENFPDFDVTAIDIAPACATVWHCDFLEVELKSLPKPLISEEQSSVMAFPIAYYDAIVFSLLLEYLPSSDQRIRCCQKAYDLLQPEGILLIITPDSRHQGANAKLMKNWRYTLGLMGFTRIKIEKLEHVTCMVFQLPIENFTIPEVASTFLHPGEIHILEELIRIANQYKEIKKFVQQYGTLTAGLLKPKQQKPSEEPLPQGLYLQAFVDGLELVVKPYRDLVVELEAKYLVRPNLSLMFIFHQVSQYRSLFGFLLQLISGVVTQRIHGCALLPYLQQHCLHGNEANYKAVKTIQKSVYVIFLKQLYGWLMHGKFVDHYGEFFIQQVESSNAKASITASGAGGASSHQPTQTTVNTSDSASINTELWRYEIRREMLPYYFPASWAEKVLFVGQTVLMCHFDPRQNLIAERASRAESKLKRGTSLSLRLLIGKELNDGTTRDLNRALQLAANSINVGEDIEQFSFELPGKDVLEDEETQRSFCYDTKTAVEQIVLKYKVKWPLHLLFSPRILERYNEMFRFLLRIKKIQHDLLQIWSYQREKRIQHNLEVVQLRNKLLFLINNLQYYLQVDVLESQFAILMAAIADSAKQADFERIQRAHTIFQANVLSLCFLLTSSNSAGEPSASSLLSTTSAGGGGVIQVHENPVLTILDSILSIVDQFCTFCMMCRDPMTKVERMEFTTYEQG
uniref:S-adenosylmethionine sensor upstream of mTORC1 n=1 Tax=Anopheles farauti TaxID=69004 RepID=A0A182Q149_9DIPT